MWILTLLAILAAFDCKDTKYIAGVIILDETTFQQALKQFANLVIYFQGHNCSYCSQFTPRFTLAAQKYRLVKMADLKDQHQFIQFAKINLTKATQPIFKTMGIDVVPTVKVLRDEKPMPQQFQKLNYDDSCVEDLAQWVYRMVTPLPRSTKSVSNGVAVNCDSVYASLLEQLRKKELGHNYFCTSDGNKDNLQVYQNGQQLKQLEFKSNYTKDPAGIFEETMNRYLYREVVEWSNDTIHTVFVKNQSAFVLIINNETKSMAALQAYEKIKSKWNQDDIAPALLTYSNLAVKVQETTTIRRFLTGTYVSNSREYPYPILGFMNYSKGRLRKYIFPFDQEINQTSLKIWMGKAVRELKMGVKADPEKTPFNISEYFNDSPSDLFEKSISEKDQLPSSKLGLISNSDFQLMLTQYKKPFFVYFNWRNDEQSAETLDRLKQWWKSDEDSSKTQKDSDKNGENKERNNFADHINFFSINLDMNDLPEHEDLHVQWIPSVFYFSPQKVISKLEGETDMDKIKQFIVQKTPITQQGSEAAQKRGKNAKKVSVNDKKSTSKKATTEKDIVQNH